MTTREDILRELELLPVWQLRTAVPKAAVETEPTPSIVETSPIETQPVPPEVALPTFRMIVSDDSAWVFLLKASQVNEVQNSEAEALLRNMLKAVEVKLGKDVVDANVQQIGQYSPKVIVVMGEQEAQLVLETTQTLEQMRGQPHQYNNIPVVVTYSPEHLLIHLGDKAKAWEDLCLAKLTIASL
jgi:DNA polymerase